MIHLKPRLFALLIVLFSLVFVRGLFAQGFPELFGSGPTSAGTEFYLAFPANWEYQAAQKYIRLYISSDVASNVDIYAGGVLKGSVTTVPGGIVTYDLSSLEGQVLVRNDMDPLPDDQIYEGGAVRIVSEEPIVVYGMNRTSFTSDGMLLLPVNALGREYVVASATSVAGGTQELPSQYMVIAPYDSTTVTITNPMDTPNHTAGTSFTIVLQEGDVFSAMSVGMGGDLTGAYIVADKPVAVTAGQNCTYLPTAEFPACDHLEEMLLPVESWGQHYHSIPFQNRTKGDTYRILAGEPGADIYVNGTKITRLITVGGGNGAGWIEFRQETRQPLEFSSNKKISVAQYNNSQTYDNAGGSDPFYMVLTPMEQYQQDLVFTTPGEDFSQNFVNIVGDSLAMRDAEITPVDQNNWQKLTDLPGTSYAFATELDGKRYRGRSFSITPGVYRLRSSGPVAGYLYAGSSFDSFGYPLSVATVALGTSIAPVDVDPPSSTHTENCDGSSQGTVQDIGPDALHTAHLSTVRLHPNSTNYQLTVDPFIPGSKGGADFSLSVIDPSAEGVAILVFTDMAGNHAFDTIRYTAPDVSLYLGSSDFGQVLPGTYNDIQITVRNNGSSPIEIGKLLLAAGAAGFSVIGPQGSFVLEPNQELTVTLRFTGSAEGTFTDSLFFTTDCGRFYLTTVRAQVGATVGVKDEEAKKAGLLLSILSNPAEGEDVLVECHLPGNSVGTLSLFNPSGLLVRQVSLAEAGETRTRIDLRNLPSGSYLCILSDGAYSVGKVLTVLR